MEIFNRTGTKESNWPNTKTRLEDALKDARLKPQRVEKRSRTAMPTKDDKKGKKRGKSVQDMFMESRNAGGTNTLGR